MHVGHAQALDHGHLAGGLCVPMEGSFQHALKLDFIPPFARRVEGAHQSGREKDGTSVPEGVPGKALPAEAQLHPLSGAARIPSGD